MTDQLKKPYTDSFVISDFESSVIESRRVELCKVHGSASKSMALRTIIREYYAMKQEPK